ncbi:hypothetical protein Pyrde_0181 [Pyrodictium delaneyi]|uniref:MIP18 family-like domain-containing protein n=1 Tax=Pyrodictium delaneyi TaxID=1273541 RepID=A0A0P0N1U4_9CREN|nr:hypothetical protein Pyrde_0181 [Pyrodictium delaneyi]
MGLLTSLLRGLVVRRPGLEGQGGAEGPLADRLREAEEALRSVVLPGYDVDIISAGLVERIRVGLDGKSIMVVLGYSRSNPGCSFCRFISSVAWTKIIRDTRRALAARGFDKIVLVDGATGAELDA